MVGRCQAIAAIPLPHCGYVGGSEHRRRTLSRLGAGMPRLVRVRTLNPLNVRVLNVLVRCFLGSGGCKRCRSTERSKQVQVGTRS